MPQMFRPGGLTRFFKSVDEGLKSGYFITFNDMALSVEGGEPAVRPAPPAGDDAPPAPVIREPQPVAVAGADSPPPPVFDDADDEMVVPKHDDLPPPSPRRPLPDMELGEVRELAKRFGLDPTIHHMTLRAQVEEKLNAQSGSD